MTISLNIIQTLAVAVIVLYIGKFFKVQIKVLERMCIPEAVVGGIIFSIITLIGYMSGLFLIKMDLTLKDVFMTIFFTAVGFTVDLKIIAKYGKRAIQFTIVLIILIISQNLIGIGLAKVFGIHPLLGLSLGSASMTGGHGTTGAFAPIFEELYGAKNALVVGLAAATFGLVSGGLIGGPVGSFLVKRHKLSSKDAARITEKNQMAISGNTLAEIEDVDIETVALSGSNFVLGSNQIMISMGIGTIIYLLLKMAGINFPSYVGGMLMGAVLRNISEYTGKFSIPLNEIDIIGNISLSLFVSMALMSLKLWELADLALPMIVTLLTQVVFISLFMIFVAFNILGRDYDAVVMITGFCGFGMGAMPNGVSNMQSFTNKWGHSPIAFLVVPGVGSVIIDVANAILLTGFMNLFG